MIMGVNRSGTNVLYRSLAADPNIKSYIRTESNGFFKNYNLKPEKEVRSLIKKSDKPILLKPINESKFRTVKDVFKEFKNYDLSIVWIYRDPVNVYRSQFVKFPTVKKGGVERFISKWNMRNKALFGALEDYDDKVVVVNYEDLILDPTVFQKLCKILKIEGKYVFREDSQKGRKLLPEKNQNEIDSGTKEVLETLQKNRKLKKSASFYIIKIIKNILKK